MLDTTYHVSEAFCSRTGGADLQYLADVLLCNVYSNTRDIGVQTILSNFSGSSTVIYR